MTSETMLYDLRLIVDDLRLIVADLRLIVDDLRPIIDDLRRTLYVSEYLLDSRVVPKLEYGRVVDIVLREVTGPLQIGISWSSTADFVYHIPFGPHHMNNQTGANIGRHA